MMAAVQWPAMIATLVATWLVGSRAKHRRRLGFWLFLAGNALWLLWGFHVRADALIVLQVGLVALNVRGAARNRDPDAEPTR
jgi:hypothetical protein